MLGECYSAAAKSFPENVNNVNNSTEQQLDTIDQILVKKSTGATVDLSECKHSNSVTLTKMDKRSQDKIIRSVVYHKAIVL